VSVPLAALRHDCRGCVGFHQETSGACLGTCQLLQLACGSDQRNRQLPLMLTRALIASLLVLVECMTNI
jgi:hypothetical protein